MKLLKTIVIFFFFSCCYFTVIHSQSLYKNIINYSVQDGLSSGIVEDIAQDSLGFIWIATKTGLNRFDGYEFKLYPANSQGEILSNQLSLVKVDNYGNIWVGYQNRGISKYDRETDSFIHYDISKDGSGFANKVIDIISENDSTILVATLNEIATFEINLNKWNTIFRLTEPYIINDEATLNKLRIANIPEKLIQKIKNIDQHFYQSDSLVQLKLMVILGEQSYKAYGNAISKTIISFNRNNIRRITKDNKDNLFFAIKDGRIFKVNLKNHKVSLFYQNKKTAALSQMRILKYYDNKLWHCGGGLNKLKITDLNTLKTHSINDIIKNTGSFIKILKSIDFDENGNFWFMCGGIHFVDLKLNKIYSIKHNQSNRPTISTELANKVMLDKNQNVWATTNKKGIIFIAKKNDFYKVELKADIEKRESNIRIAAINKDSRDNLWVVDRADGIYILDEENGNIIKEFINNTPFQAASASTFLEDKDGNMWIGTYLNGIYMYNPETDKFSRAFSSNDDFNKFVNRKVFSIIQDNNNNIWFGTKYLGLLKYEIENKKLIGFRKNQGNQIVYKDNFAYKILEDRKGSIWVCGNETIHVLHQGQQNFREYKELVDGQLNEIFKVEDFIEASDGTIWLASFNGLINIENDSITIYEMPNSDMKSLIEDDIGNIWIGSGNGLFRFNMNTYKFKKFTVLEGIPSNNFERRSVTKTNKGTLYFGTDNGLMYFNPKNISSISYKPNPIITCIRLFNKIVNVGDTVDGRVVLRKSIEVLDEITLHHRENDFSLEFAAIHYEAPEKFNYHYILEGFDKDWKVTNYLNRRAYYTNLSPGKYLFKLFIKGSENEQSNYKNLIINIQPAWWNTWFFRVFIIIVILIGFYGFLQLRIALIKKQKKHLEKAVKERTMEIEEKNIILEDQAVELKKQAEYLHDVNHQLEERQEMVINQSDELKKQAEYLTDINTSLAERQKKIEEQAQQLKKQSDTLRQTNRDLKILNSTKDKLFSIIAHDLKNPFGTVIGYTELLINNESRYDNNKKNKFLHNILKSADNANRLLENLLDWSRIQIGQEQFDPERFSLTNEILSNIEIAEQMISNKEINCIFKKDVNIEITADKNMIQTVIRNILTNAIKFTPKKGTITIETSVSNDIVEVSITDTGIGIEEKEIDKLFKGLKTSTKFGTERESGTGLGLVLCKEFIDKHKGKLWVKSKPGIGSTFTFRIPINVNE